MTETHNLNKLANLIKDNFSDTEIQFLNNPRKELISNDLKVTNKQFLDCGLEPIKLDSDRLTEIHTYINEHKTDIIEKSIYPSSFW